MVQPTVESDPVDKGSQLLTDDDAVSQWNEDGTEHRGGDRDRWLERHGVRYVDSLGGGLCCTAGLAGVPPEPSLMCLDLTEPKWLKTGALLYVGIIWSIRDKRPQIILKTPIAAGPADPLSKDEVYSVKLLVKVSADGTRLVLTDSPEHSCASGLSRLATLSKPGDAWAAQTRQLYNEVCKARGTYVWQNGRYRRQMVTRSERTSQP